MAAPTFAHLRGVTDLSGPLLEPTPKKIARDWDRAFAKARSRPAANQPVAKKSDAIARGWDRAFKAVRG